MLLLEDNIAEVLPPDAVSRDGFVNNQETLQLSPLLLETYLELSDQALSPLLVDPQSKPTIQNFRVELGGGDQCESAPRGTRSSAPIVACSTISDFIGRAGSSPTSPSPSNRSTMRTKYRFIEGYQGNDTVRGWRDYDSIYHAVFADMRGTAATPKGTAYSTGARRAVAAAGDPQRGRSSAWRAPTGRAPNFKIALRELPSQAAFRVTVAAAKYDDGLLLDPRRGILETDQSRRLPRPQVEVADSHSRASTRSTCMPSPPPSAAMITLTLGERQFTAAPGAAGVSGRELPCGAAGDQHRRRARRSGSSSLRSMTSA